MVKNNNKTLAKDYIAISPHNRIYSFTCAKDWLVEQGMSVSVFNTYLDSGIIPETPIHCRRGIETRKKMEFWQFYHRENYFGKLPEREDDE